MSLLSIRIFCKYTFHVLSPIYGQENGKLVLKSLVWSHLASACVTYTIVISSRNRTNIANKLLLIWFSSLL